MGIKVIFLDVDGVLNDYGQLIESYDDGGGNDVICADMVARLNKIIDATDAVCVLSSTWRIAFGMQKTLDLMKKRGFTGEMIGETPDMVTWRCSSTRGHECAAWLEENDHIQVESYLILDDDEDFPGMEDRRIRTSFGHANTPAGTEGLQDRHIEQAIEILNKPLWKDSNAD